MRIAQIYVCVLLLATKAATFNVPSQLSSFSVCLGNFVKDESHCKCDSISVQHPLKIPSPKKEIPKLCVFFVDHYCKFHTLSNSIKLTYKISEERKIAIASVVGYNLSSNLRIIILCLITKLIFKYKSLQSSFTIYTDQCTDRSC